jgi:hypothetical protein
MSSYLTPYNVASAKQQKGFDVRNLANDVREAGITPLYGGRQGDFQMEGGDFWSDFADGFMSVMRPLGEVAKVVAPFIPKGAGVSGGMACRCPSRAIGNHVCRCGRGLSGGDEITDAEPALLNPDLNSTGLYHGGYNEQISGMGQSGGSWAIARLLAPELSIPYDLATGKNPLTGDTWGSGMSGGDFLSDLGNIASTVAPFLPLLGLGEDSTSDDKTRAVGGALMGCGFFDDLLSGISKVGEVASAVAPHVETGMKLYEKFGKKGKGLSGGMSVKQKAIGKKLLSELKALHGRGLSGGGLSGGDFDWGTLASFAPLLLGLGMSGGQSEPDMSYLEPFVSGFGLSGGSFVDDLLKGIENAVGKVGDFLESGVNKVSEGLDKVMPLVEKVGKVADVAGKVVGAVSGKKGEGMSGGSLGQRYGNASDTRKLSGKQQLYKGGNIPNGGIPPFNKITNAGMSGGDMSVNAPYVGFDTATGKDFKRPVGGNSVALMAQQQRSNVNQPYRTGVDGGGRCCFNVVGSKSGVCNGTKAYRHNVKTGRKSANAEKRSVKGRGQAGNSETLDEIEATNDLVNALASSNPAVNASPDGTESGRVGGKRASKWIEHVKAYAKQHGVSYKQALKDAKATYRGAGMSGGGASGGDFWSDLGNVASTVAPFLPLLL